MTERSSQASGGSSRWAERDDVPRGADYDSRWEHLRAAGSSIHGEADFVMEYEPRSVLDAGCGTGRVAIELASRGVETVGVDLDEAMLDQARAKAPKLEWVEGDLAYVDLERRFDVAVLAGNVMIFVQPGTESLVVSNMASHLNHGGLLISGFSLEGAYGLVQYERDCEAAGLEQVARFATWERGEWEAGGDYAVSVHRPRQQAAQSAS